MQLVSKEKSIQLSPTIIHIKDLNFNKITEKKVNLVKNSYISFKYKIFVEKAKEIKKVIDPKDLKYEDIQKEYNINDDNKPKIKYDKIEKNEKNIDKNDRGDKSDLNISSYNNSKDNNLFLQGKKDKDIKDKEKIDKLKRDSMLIKNKNENLNFTNIKIGDVSTKLKTNIINPIMNEKKLDLIDNNEVLNLKQNINKRGSTSLAKPVVSRSNITNDIENKQINSNLANNKIDFIPELSILKDIKKEEIKIIAEKNKHIQDNPDSLTNSEIGLLKVDGTMNTSKNDNDINTKKDKNIRYIKSCFDYVKINYPNSTKSKTNECESLSFCEGFFIAGIKENKMEIIKNFYECLAPCKHNSCSILFPYKPKILTKFVKNSKDFEINDLTASLCFPYGLKVCLSNENNYLQPIKNIFTYLTNTSGERFYMTTLQYYTKINIQDFEKKWEIDVLKEYFKSIPEIEEFLGNNGDLFEQKIENITTICNNFTSEYIYIPQCLALISRYPYVKEMNYCLESIFKIILDDSIKRKNREILNFVKHLIYEIPLPPINSRVLSLIPYNNLILSIPSINYNNYKITNQNPNFLFKKYNFEFIMLVLNLIILEQKIIFVDEDVKNICTSIDCFLTLIQPLVWNNPIIPLLNEEIVIYIQSIAPYIMGSTENLYNIRIKQLIEKDYEIYFIFLDKQKIELNFNNKIKKVDPKSISKLLPQFPDDIYEHIKNKYNDYFSTASKKTSSKASTDDQSIKNKESNYIINIEFHSKSEIKIREIFLGLMSILFGDYKKYLSYIEDEAVFNSESFLYGKRKKNKFYYDLINTQNFRQFLQNRIEDNNEFEILNNKNATLITQFNNESQNFNEGIFSFMTNKRSSSVSTRVNSNLNERKDSINIVNNTYESSFELNDSLKYQNYSDMTTFILQPYFINMNIERNNFCLTIEELSSILIEFNTDKLVDMSEYNKRIIKYERVKEIFLELEYLSFQEEYDTFNLYDIPSFSYLNNSELDFSKDNIFKNNQSQSSNHNNIKSSNKKHNLVNIDNNDDLKSNKFNLNTTNSNTNKNSYNHEKLLTDEFNSAKLLIDKENLGMFNLLGMNNNDTPTPKSDNEKNIFVYGNDVNVNENNQEICNNLKESSEILNKLSKIHSEKTTTSKLCLTPEKKVSISRQNSSGNFLTKEEKEIKNCVHEVMRNILLSEKIKDNLFQQLTKCFTSINRSTSFEYFSKIIFQTKFFDNKYHCLSDESFISLQSILKLFYNNISNENHSCYEHCYLVTKSLFFYYKTKNNKSIYIAKSFIKSEANICKIWYDVEFWKYWLEKDINLFLKNLKIENTEELYFAAITGMFSNMKELEIKIEFINDKIIEEIARDMIKNVSININY